MYNSEDNSDEVKDDNRSVFGSILAVIIGIIIGYGAFIKGSTISIILLILFIVGMIWTHRS